MSLRERISRVLVPGRRGRTFAALLLLLLEQQAEAAVLALGMTRSAALAFPGMPRRFLAAVTALAVITVITAS
jgi:hypothetical protein